MPSEFTLKVEGKTRHVTVVRRKNQKRIIIRPKPDGYTVSAPLRTPVRTLRKIVTDHFESLESLTPRIDFNQTLEMPKTLFIFGRPHPVVYEALNGGVFFDEERIIVRSKALNKDNVKRLLRAFLKTVLLGEVKRIHQQTKMAHPSYDLRGVAFDAGYAHTKFGSCTYQTRRIRFNLVLVHYPRHFLRYIYHHEISHLRHPDHSQSFYRTFEHFEPDHMRLKKTLHEHHEQYMRDIKNHI